MIEMVNSVSIFFQASLFYMIIIFMNKNVSSKISSTEIQFEIPKYFMSSYDVKRRRAEKLTK